MKQEEAKNAILDLWKDEKKPWEEGDHQAFYNSAQSFYLSLKSKNSGLLNFRCEGDKWQVVKGWINQYEGYPNC